VFAEIGLCRDTLGGVACWMLSRVESRHQGAPPRYEREKMKTTEKHTTWKRDLGDGFYLVADESPLDFGYVKRASFDVHPSDGSVCVALSDYFLDTDREIFGHDFVMSFVSPASARAMATALLNAAAAAESN